MYNNKIDFFAPKSWDSSLQKHNSNFPTGSLPEPDFDCISENVLETWQKDNKTFKKTEYTMRLVVAGKHGCQMAIAGFLESYVFGPSSFWTMAPLRCKI